MAIAGSVEKMKRPQHTYMKVLLKYEGGGSCKNKTPLVLSKQGGWVIKPWQNVSGTETIIITMYSKTNIINRGDHTGGT